MAHKSSKQQQLIDEQKKIFKNRKVVQLNKFIKGDVSAFSVNDLKIFKLIISKVDSKDSLFKDFYELSTDEIKALNISEKHLYNETKKTLKRLANIYITFDDEDSVREVGLIRNDFKFEKYSKKILINFNDDMGEYLINLKKNFFMYDLIDIVNFKFKHTLKFYEYLKSHNLNVIKLKIETIKEILDLQYKYKRYTNFKNDVLEVIVEEINECSNTLFISYSEEKRGAKVEYIIFHVKRINSELILDAPKSNKKYSSIIGLECEYLNKYHTIEEVDEDNKLIVLKELHTDTLTNIVKETDNGFNQLINDLVGKNQKKDDEIDRLRKANDFKVFKKETIDNYIGKDLVNCVPGFDEDIIFALQESTGYIYEKDSLKVLSKEDSLIVWKYLFSNKDKVGQIEKIDPTAVYKNVSIYIKKLNKDGLTDKIKYQITDIKEEIENEEIKYRLYSKNLDDPFSDIERSKSLLTLEEVKTFIESSRI